jgi:tetratricopeptide (TPR) repeat protein
MIVRLTRLKRSHIHDSMRVPTIVLSQADPRISTRLPLRFAACLTVLAYSLLNPGATASALQQSGGSFSQFAAKAQKASEENRLDDAARLYARALAIKPKWAEGWWALATLEYDQDHYAKAVAAFKKMVALQAKNGTAFAMLGLCEFELGHEQASLRDIEKGVDLGLQTNPDLQHVVLYHEGLLLQRQGRFQAAQETLEQVCLQGGPSDTAANVLGMALLRSAAKEPPPAGSADADVVLRVGRAACLAGQKKYDAARPEFESVVSENPKYPNIHYAFGLFLLELRDVTGAVEQLKQEVANDPSDVVARLRIAASEYKRDSASGIPYAEEAVKLAPAQPFGHYLLGLLRLDVDDYLKAIPELEIAQKGLPREPKIYAALGTAYSRAGRKQEAAQARVVFARLTEEGKKAAADNLPEPRSTGPEKIPVGDISPPPQ